VLHDGICLLWAWLVCESQCCLHWFPCKFFYNYCNNLVKLYNTNSMKQGFDTSVGLQERKSTCLLNSIHIRRKLIKNRRPSSKWKTREFRTKRWQLFDWCRRINTCTEQGRITQGTRCFWITWAQQRARRNATCAEQLFGHFKLLLKFLNARLNA
jgi:hypothetical protein